MSDKKPKIRGLSQILTFFRKNTTPIFFVSPTAFNLLGVEKFVNRFYHINYFDSFDGFHPRVFVPREAGVRDFESMEEVCNYLLSHKEVIDRIRKSGGGPAKLLFVMFDEETEELAKELGVEIAHPSAALRSRLDSKIETTRLANEAGIASAPNVLGRADSFESLMTQAEKAGLGGDLVVQTPYGDSGRTTFFIKGREDWDKNADDMVDEHLKIMKRINHMPGTLEACVTRRGTLVGPVQTDITGFAEITPYKGGWCGNDANPRIFNQRVRRDLRQMAQALGDRLYQEGYKGVFCMDFLIDTDDGTPYLGEINPRISGASPLTNLVTATYGGAPLFLFHLLEYLDVDYEIDLRKMQRRWLEFDIWSQLILKQTEDKVQLLTGAPTTGVWHMNKDGAIEFGRRELDWTNVIDNDEAYYLRVYREGDYLFKGADLGIVVARGRMQTDRRELRERAKLWTAGIKAQFEGVPPPEPPAVEPHPLSSKLY
ncbi:MAG: biotin carboxylase [Kiloniellales bacterium]